jgi:hypothetical protein
VPGAFVIGAIAAVFAGPYAMLAKWAVIGLLLAAFGGWAWFKGNEHGTQKLIDFKGELAAQAVRIGTARERVTTQVVIEYVKVAGKTETVTTTVEKEVVRYADANLGSCLDADFRRLHDLAAANRLPGPAAPADDPVRTPPAAPARRWLNLTEGVGSALHGHLQLRAAPSLRGPSG